MLISVTDIIKKSWELYSKHWRDLSVYMLIMFLPTLILLIIGVVSVYLTLYLPASALFNDIITLIVLAASLLFGLWVSLALMRAIKSLYKDARAITWREAFLKTLPLLWPVIYTSILTTIVVIGGAVLMIVPGIIFTVWYLFAVQEILFAGQKGIGAMRGSKQLVTGRWWSVAWRVAAPITLFIATSLALQELLVFPFTFINSAIDLRLARNIISSFVNAVIAPLTVTAILVLYFNAKETPVAPPPPPTDTTSSI